LLSLALRSASMTPPTAFQRKIAKALGLSLRGADRASAGARIHDYIAPALVNDIDPQPPTARQVKFAQDLGIYADGDTFQLLVMKIQGQLTRRNAAALQQLRLKPGDIVDYARRASFDDPTTMRTTRHVVSSIGNNLRVYFKNPVSESGGWPSQLTKVNEVKRPDSRSARRR
jgi:hypothetical protein